MPPKVVVIGLDGATFTLLAPWMAEGRLPYLRSLMAAGASGPLRSSIPPVTVPAWQCFMTGKNPAKIGVAGFFEQKAGSYEETPVTAASCRARTLWDMLADAGVRAAVLNLPYARVPQTFNGVAIGGFDTPPERIADAVHPPGLLAEIERECGPYRVYLRTPQWLAPLLAVNRFEFAIDWFLRDCAELTEYQFRVARWLIARDDFDAVVFYQLATDRIQHWLWYLLDESHPRHDPALAARFRERIIAYYDRLDAEVAALVRSIGGDPVVMIVSDHGFGPVARGIDLNSFLLARGYQAIARRPGALVKRALWRLGWGPHRIIRPLLSRPLRWRVVQRRLLRSFGAQTRFHAWDQLLRALNRWLFLSTDDVDRARSLAYCLAEFGMIRVNVKGREPLGAVEPARYAAVRDRLVAELRALVDPATGERVDADVFVKEETYQGEHIDAMPDVAFIPLAKPYLAVNPTTFLTRRVFIDDIGVTGFHQLDGILIARGPFVREGAAVRRARLMDLAPTILYLLGLPIPDDMDGRVLTELFDPARLAERPVETFAAPVAANGAGAELSSSDREAVLARLKGLGYVD